MNDVVVDHDGQNGNQKNPEDAFHDRDPGIAAGAADRFDVVQEHYDDLAESQGNDRQIVALQTQRRNSDNETGDGGTGCADHGRDQECYDPTESAVAERGGDSDTIVDRE